MAGRPYAAGGHPRHHRGTTRRGRRELTPRLAARPPRRGACAPASRTSRSSRATGSTSRPSGGCATVAGEFTDDVTFLGAHAVPPEYEGRADDYVDARLRRDARRLRAATRAGSTCSARRARSTPTSRARCSRRAATPGSASACTATSSAPGRACSSPSSWARRRSTTAPTCPTPDIDALAGERHRRHVPARPPTSRPASPTRTRAARSTPA